MTKDNEKKSLEMRVADLEDKQRGLNITDEEMATYTKVATALGACVQAAACVSPNACVQAADRKSTRLNSSHPSRSRMPSSA